MKNMTFEQLPDILKPREAADWLGVSTLTIKRWCKAGKLKASRINTRGDRRVNKNDLINYINSNTIKGGEKI